MRTLPKLPLDTPKKSRRGGHQADIYSGTFLSAPPSGVLSATTPSRGPLEAFVPLLTPASSSSSGSSSSSSAFPTLHLKTNSLTFLSSSSAAGLGSKVELRADADTAGAQEGLRIKCQREFVLRARLEKEDAKGGEGGTGKVRRMLDGGAKAGSLEDEMNRK